MKFNFFIQRICKAGKTCCLFDFCNVFPPYLVFLNDITQYFYFLEKPEN